MRTGDFKQTYGELVTLVEFPAGMAVVGGAGRSA